MSDADADVGPARHPAIPADAKWRLELDKWEEVAVDAAGVKTGAGRLYREDGTLYMTCTFAGGREDGPFTVYHPNGEIARNGHYRAGELDGLVVARLAQSGEGEPLRSCCVPEPAVEMRTHYEGGQLVSERFFDSAGKALLSDGSLCPERPAGLPASADYDEGGGRWMVAPGKGGDSYHRFYRQDGRLDEEALIERGWRTYARLYASDGSVKAELRNGENGRREGAFRRRFIEGDASPFRDPRIAEERGTYRDDVAVGRFSYHDESGALVAEVNHGEPPQGDFADEAFADEQREPEAWTALSEALAGQGRVPLALVAAARAAARKREPDDLVAALARHTVALADGPALELASKAAGIEGEAQLPALLAGLVAGGDAAELLRALAAITPAPRAALDLVDAAMLLAPDRPTNYLTRALARLDVGDDGGALADARQLEPISPPSAEFLRLHTRTLFPEWAFAVRERFDEAAEVPEGIPEGPAQPLEQIRAVMQIYATRLGLLREAVIARAPKRARAAWLPPALPELLPEGPVPLRAYEGSITDETDEGAETTPVAIDETLDPEALARAGVTALMRRARADHAALCWLAWSAGLSRLALPTTLAPPAAFPTAAVAGITRFFRLQDALITGGLRSQTAGAPSFAFQGIDVDQLPRPTAEVALEEMSELRAVFLWLLSPENLSPFQSDLREG